VIRSGRSFATLLFTDIVGSGVAQAWAYADPEMRALAEEARQGAIRLGGLRRG
jgi:hypothetical protein